MADDLLLNAGTGGKTLRSLNDGTDDWPVGVCGYPTTILAGANVVQIVDPTHGLPVQPQTGSTWAVTGTFWQATQPVSAASLPLPTGASTAANQSAGNTSLASIDGKITACNTGAVVVSSSALPTGAATAAKQPSLGTAGAASADVLTVQGVVGMTALKVDGSGVTQPVSGTLTGITNVVHVDDNGGSLTVDGTVAVSGSVAVTGTFWQATQPVSAASLPLPTGAATESTLSTLNGKVTACNTGAVTVSAALPAGSNLVGRVNPEPQTANGLSVSRVLSAASTNATSVKASPGQVYSIYAANTNAAVRYLKLYNKASAPTVGTDTPVLTLPIPGNAAGAGFVLDTGGMGIAFGTGIALAVTTGAGDTDTGAVGANEVIVNLLYK